MHDAYHLANFVFHVYNRSNDRSTLFHSDENYRVFLAKVIKQLPPVAYLLGYCIMPNHFHFLLIPKHPIRDDFPLDGERHFMMPTAELGEAVRRLLMGYSKSYNKYYQLTGSRFRQKSKAKHHKGTISNGLSYIHDNPVEAKLVGHPSEWSYSSFNEYSGGIKMSDCICDIELGRALLEL